MRNLHPSLSYYLVEPLVNRWKSRSGEREKIFCRACDRQPAWMDEERREGLDADIARQSAMHIGSRRADFIARCSGDLKRIRPVPKKTQCQHFSKRTAGLQLEKSHVHRLMPNEPMVIFLVSNHLYLHVFA